MATLLVNDVTPRLQYTATSGQTVFAYTFAIFADGDLKVYLTPNGNDADDTADILTLTTNYTVSGAATTSGGNVTLVVAATSGDIITIERNLAVARTIDYQNLGDLESETFNDDLDKQIMMIQQNELQVSRSIRLSHSDALVSSTILPVPLAGNAIVWNDTANGLENGGIPGAISSTQKTVNTVSVMDGDATLTVGDILETAGYLAKGDNGANRYEIVAAATGTDDGGRWIDLTASGFQAKGLFPDGEIRVEQFGAAADNSTDDLNKLNNASTYSNTSGLPLVFTTKSYSSDKVTFYSGQRIKGMDRTESGISVDASFNLSATAMVDLGSTEPGPTITDFGIFCDQDTTESVRANIIQYPPAIRAVACPRFILDRIRIEGAKTAIDCTGNSGGSRITNAEIGALTIGIDMNGALDFMFFDNIEFWNFGIGVGNLYNNVYSDGATIGCNTVDVDGVMYGSIGAFRTHMVFDNSFGNVSNLGCDAGYGRIEAKGGSKLSVGAFYSTSDKADDYAISVSGAGTILTIGTARITNATDLTGSNGLIQLLTNSTAELVIGNLYAKTSGLNTRLVYQTEGDLHIDGGYFETPQNVSLVNDYIDINGGRCHISDISTLDKGTGTGNLIAVASNDRHSFTNITAPGWPVVLPASSSKIKTGNNDWDTKTSGTRELTARYTHVYTGSLSGGAATVAHGLSNPNTKYADITAWEITSGVIRTLMTGVTIEGTNINLSGGTGTNVYEVVLQVRE